MRFSELSKAIGIGLLPLIPVMGSVLVAIIAERDRGRFEERLIELIQQRSASHVEPQGSDRVIDSALTLAQAELIGSMETQASPQNRFLYLAGETYAGVEPTRDIAERCGFLWRSYYKDSKKGEANANVKHIRIGDVIALAYRIDKKRFRLMLPLIVIEGNENTRAITPLTDKTKLRLRDPAPFVRADDTLSELLRQHGYLEDPKLHVFTGLAVKPLYTDVGAAILQGTFSSPTGNNALWHHDYRKGSNEVPPPVRDWIEELGNRPVGTT